MPTASTRLRALVPGVRGVLLAGALACGGASAAPLPVTVTLHDHGFGFNDIGFRATHVQLTVVNRGHRPHALAIGRRHGAPVARTGRLAPGQRTRLALDLKPGRYRLYSPVDHDRAHGLSAPLEVLSPSPAGKGGAETNRVFYDYGRRR